MASPVSRAHYIVTVDLCKGSMPATLSLQSADAVCPPVGDQVTTDAGQCLGGVYTGQGRCRAPLTEHWSCHTLFIPTSPHHHNKPRALESKKICHVSSKPRRTHIYFHGLFKRIITNQGAELEAINAVCTMQHRSQPSFNSMS